jgi:hypothetical protein
VDFAKDGKLPQWYFKTFINTVHILRYLIKALTITLHAHRQRFYEALDESTTVIIRSESDTFLSPDAERLLKQKAGRSFRFYGLPGQHDTCWRDPGPYIDIILREAGPGRPSQTS